MKKSTKAIIAILIIAAIAVGVYFIFFNGTDNKQIRAKVYGLNNNVIVKDINIYSKINQTIDEMVGLINSKNYNIPEVKAYLEEYSLALDNYLVVNNSILEYGVFVNKTNTNDYFKNMNKAYDNLVKIYKDCNDYLLGTYFAVTNPDNYNSDYIVSFQFLFKDALKELNDFYYNAGMAYSYAAENLFEINNLYKLKVGYYSAAVYCRVNDYLDNQTIDYSHNLSAASYKDGKQYVDKYVKNKAEYDGLVSAKLNISELVLAEAKGEASTYIQSITKESKKSNLEKYYNLIIKG